MKCVELRSIFKESFDHNRVSIVRLDQNVITSFGHIIEVRNELGTFEYFITCNSFKMKSIFDFLQESFSTLLRMRIVTCITFEIERCY